MARGPRIDGSKIRRVREERAMLQRREVAQAAGVSYQTMYNIESGAQKTTRRVTLRKIARVLGVEVSELLESEELLVAGGASA